MRHWSAGWGPGAARCAKVVATAFVEEVRSPVQIRLFGGVAATDAAGTALDVGPAKCQVVLAALALEPGSAVPVHRLISLVWGEDAPRTAERTLQSYVARLRRGLGPSAIVRAGSAYRLELDAEHVDVGRFERRLAAGDLAAALGEWGGDPLAGIDAPGLGPVVDRLTETWLAALERDLEDRLGRDPSAVVAALTELTVRHPFREGLWALLMTGLYRTGRQADALAAFRRARQVLVEDLGVEPGPRLRDLEALVLAQDPGLGAVPAERPPAALTTAVAAPLDAPVGSSVPALLVRLIGRGRERAAVTDALAGHRLVTLTGPGGVGKTTLGLAVLHDTGGNGQAVRFIDLSVVAAGRDVPRAVLDALQVGHGGAADPAETVVAAVGDAAAVLLLDNCEHVVDAAAALAQLLLTRCPAVRLLTTSRQPLGLVGERVLVVPPLDTDHDAVQLFAERAVATNPAFALDAVRADVTRLCRRLDGVPLAIELAASRARTLSPAELFDRLGGSHRLLADPDRATPARHRSLNATVAWSYELLTDDERTVYQRLSVFAGSFDLGAAEAVAADRAAALEVVDALDRLVRRSMVAVQHGADTGGVRFRLLDAMRRHAAEQLARAGGAGLAEQRHIAWCLERVRTIGQALAGPGEPAAVAALHRLWPELRVAFDRACSQRDAALARSLVEPVAAESFLRSRDEIGEWAERLLELAGPNDEELTVFGLMWAARRYLRHRDHAGFERLTARYGEPDHPLVQHARALVYEDHPRLAELCPPLAAAYRRQGATYLADLYEVGHARALLASGRFERFDEVAADLLARLERGGSPTFLHWVRAMAGYAAARRGHDDADRWFAASAAVAVPEGTHSRNEPVAARAAIRAGDRAQAFRILHEHTGRLLARRDLYEARLLAIDVVGLLEQAARREEAAQLLGYLDATGLLEVPAFACLVEGVAGRLASALPGQAGLRARGRLLDDTAALTLLHTLTGELAAAGRW